MAFSKYIIPIVLVVLVYFFISSMGTGSFSISGLPHQTASTMWDSYSVVLSAPTFSPASASNSVRFCNNDGESIENLYTGGSSLSLTSSLNARFVECGRNGIKAKTTLPAGTLKGTCTAYANAPIQISQGSSGATCLVKVNGATIYEYQLAGDEFSINRAGRQNAVDTFTKVIEAGSVEIDVESFASAYGNGRSNLVLTFTPTPVTPTPVASPVAEPVSEVVTATRTTITSSSNSIWSYITSFFQKIKDFLRL